MHIPGEVCDNFCPFISGRYQTPGQEFFSCSPKCAFRVGEKCAFKVIALKITADNCDTK